MNSRRRIRQHLSCNAEIISRSGSYWNGANTGSWPDLAHLGPVGRHSAGPLSGAQRLRSRPPSAASRLAFEHSADLVVRGGQASREAAPSARLWPAGQQTFKRRSAGARKARRRLRTGCRWLEAPAATTPTAPAAAVLGVGGATALVMFDPHDPFLCHDDDPRPVGRLVARLAA
jgi:hypothetical protein